jgi:DNA-binding LytR/AlgR family response regulator
MKIRCLVADDEPLALKLISEYISRIPHLAMVGTCKRATDIPAYIGQIDLLFLDIRMPGISGIELLRSMPGKPLVIMITAYSEHALEGFELDVVDYLVKPVAFERFFHAVNRATRQYELERRTPPHDTVLSDPDATDDQPVRDYFFVKSGYKSVRINFGEILYVEGLKEYVSIYTTGDRKFVKLAALKDLERILPQDRFLRIHKSYIVAVNKVTAAYGNTVELNQVSLPVGRMFKEKVMKIFS